MDRYSNLGRTATLGGIALALVVAGCSHSSEIDKWVDQTNQQSPIPTGGTSAPPPQGGLGGSAGAGGLAGIGSGVRDCPPGFGNCDHDPSNGCEAPLNGEMNCERCGQTCLLPNALSSCALGTCQIIHCAPDFQDCDGDPRNGCETFLKSIDNCGACGAPCVIPGQLTSCATGFCVPTDCPPGTDNCGPGALGCQTTLGTPLNCRGCGHACNLPHAIPACVNGRCRIEACEDGFKSCDQRPQNGCETSVRTLDNCGECERSCDLEHAVVTCMTGICEFVRCQDGYGDCDHNPQNGCEADLASDPHHCGSCNIACPRAPHAHGSCSSGRCTVECDSGYGNCDNDPRNGCEANLATSVANCGECGRRCVSPVPYQCVGGSCRLSCPGGTADCNRRPHDGCEVQLASDARNCGACGVRCSRQGNQTCVNGMCVSAGPGPGMP